MLKTILKPTELYFQLIKIFQDRELRELIFTLILFVFVEISIFTKSSSLRRYNDGKCSTPDMDHPPS